MLRLKLSPKGSKHSQSETGHPNSFSFDRVWEEEAVGKKASRKKTTEIF